MPILNPWAEPPNLQRLRGRNLTSPNAKRFNDCDSEWLNDPSMGGIDSIPFRMSLISLKASGHDISPFKSYENLVSKNKLVKIMWKSTFFTSCEKMASFYFKRKSTFFHSLWTKNFSHDFHRVIVSKAFCVASFLNHWQDTYRQYSSVCLLPNPLNSWAEAPHDQRFWEADPKRDRLNKWFNKCESFKGLSYCLLFSYVNPSKDPFAVHDKLPSFSVLSEPLKGPSCLILAHHSFWRRF